jgi:ribosomal protein S18 acetylase RimI-like enzyme
MIRATLDDAPRIRELTRKAYAEWVPLIGREPKPMGDDYVFAVQNHIVDLVEVNDVLAGLFETIPFDDHLLIENVAVDPAFQGQGYGRA